MLNIVLNNMILYTCNVTFGLISLCMHGTKQLFLPHNIIRRYCKIKKSYKSVIDYDFQVSIDNR